MKKYVNRVNPIFAPSLTYPLALMLAYVIHEAMITTLEGRELDLCDVNAKVLAGWYWNGLFLRKNLFKVCPIKVLISRKWAIIFFKVKICDLLQVHHTDENKEELLNKSIVPLCSSLQFRIIVLQQRIRHGGAGMYPIIFLLLAAHWIWKY